MRINELKKVKIASLVIAILILVYLYKNGIIAPLFVNGEPITLGAMYFIYKNEGPKNIIDKAISKKLFEIEAKRRNIEVTKEEIEAEIARVEREALKGGKTLAQVLSEKDQTLAEFQVATKTRLLIYKLLEGELSFDDARVQKVIEENNYLFKDEEEAERTYEELRKLLIEAEIDKQYKKWVKEAKAKSKIKYLVDF